MGGICCIAARDKDVPEGTVGNAVHRNFRCSPTWSFNWDNRRRVAGEIDIDDSSYQLSSGIEDSHKAIVQDVAGTNSITQTSDPGSESSCFMEEQNGAGSAGTVSFSASKDANSLRLSFSTPARVRPSAVPPSSTPSRTARRSPARQLVRQISDSRIMEMRSPNSNSFSGGRRSSCALSSCNRELATGSNCGSSDSWSVRTFSELVASSRRERWSFESEQFSSAFSKMAAGSSNRLSSSPASLDPQTCAACSELLACWRRGELSVVAVLSCGHVYHADCLETMTDDIDRYDPACLICHRVERQISKICSRAMADVGANLNSNGFYCQTNRVLGAGAGRRTGPNFGPSTSYAKPFLRRHFSFGSKTSRSHRPDSRFARKRKIFRKLSQRLTSGNR